MDSEVTDLAGVKTVTISTLQVKPSEGAFADGDKTKLDAIAAGAQVNVSGDSGNAAVYDNSGTPTLKSGITKTEIQTLINVEDGAKDDQTAAEVVSTATTNIAALTVQTALAELDAEKLALAGGTMSGDITMGANDISGTGSVTATTFSGNLVIPDAGTIGSSSDTDAISISAAGITNLNSTTTSTSSTTGALIVDGGVGIAENLNVGGTLDVTGDTNLNSTTTSTNSTTGALVVDGGVGVAENLNVGGAIDVTDATTTRNNLGIYTGTETHPGGSAGVEHTVTNGNVTANSIIIITLTQSSSTPLFIKSTTNGSFIVSNTAFSPSATFNYLIIN
jgi:hypothetical protein